MKRMMPGIVLAGVAGLAFVRGNISAASTLVRNRFEKLRLPFQSAGLVGSPGHGSEKRAGHNCADHPPASGRKSNPPEIKQGKTDAECCEKGQPFQFHDATMRFGLGSTRAPACPDRRLAGRNGGPKIQPHFARELTFPLLPMNLAPVKPWESARGLAQSETLTCCPGALDPALASWSAPVLWRFALRFRGRGMAVRLVMILTVAVALFRPSGRASFERRGVVGGGANHCTQGRVRSPSDGIDATSIKVKGRGAAARGRFPPGRILRDRRPG